ncbi:MAG: hypothetical protein NTV48_01025 [Candidatus Vogelbacteria bacterium]|nr:hypothetical protein [Candidatus Vogelbacteria bacterium]
MDKFIVTLDEYFGKKAPQLPAGLKEFIVKVSPYLAIIGLILFGLAIIPLISLVFGLGVMNAYVAAVVPMTSVYISFVIMIIVEIMYLLAIPGLFKRTKKAWNFMFYAQIAGAVSSLVSYNILGAIIGLVIGFYILFQVRSYYKN